MDLSSRSYQTGGAVLSRLNGYINSLANFTGASFNGVRVTEVSQRVLQVAVPAVQMNPSQQQAFETATVRAAQVGVQIVVTQVP